MKSREETITLPLEYITVSFFILPLFLSLPEWYLTLETVLGVILIGFMMIGAGTLWIMLAYNRSAPVEQSYFTMARGFAVLMNIIILVSMFLQGMDEIFMAYLLVFSAFNVGSYMWMKK